MNIKKPSNLEFITPIFMRVFNSFLEDPLKELHEREAVRETKVSSGSVHKVLTLLAYLDFLVRKRRGKMVFYRLNVGNPTVRQFKVLKNVHGIVPLIDSIRPYAKKAVLFGSCAEGTDTMESDIDLLVLSLEKGQIRKCISDFNRKSERQVAPVIRDSNEMAALKREDKAFYENVMRGIVLWEKE